MLHERVTGAQPSESSVVGNDRLAPVLAAAEEHARFHDEASTFPSEALAALRQTRLLGLLVAVDHGGLGGGLRDMAVISQRLGRVDLSTALVYAMHCQQVAALTRYARPELQASLLPRIAAGEVYLASVTTEVGSHGQLLTGSSRLVGDGQGMLRLERDAPVVTGAGYADGFLITMLAPDATAPTQVTLVYADRSQLSVAKTGRWSALGMRATESLSVQLSGKVPVEQVVGELGGFRDIATTVFMPWAHIGWAACWLGSAGGALARCVRYLRSHSGRRSHDVTSELLLTRLARVRARLEVVHALLARVLWVAEQAEDLSAPPVQMQLNALKIVAAEQSIEAADDLVELMGLRHGYMSESPLWLERTLRDLRSASLNYGNDRLYLSNGRLALLDPEVHFA
jgi:acyl-CoA dehydrogenase